ncbi:E3 ubiquitin-protein ligase CCNB1IP1 homolog isoform X3 [Camellia sinensis]|nr:E3 ubiquitin-protein ligase CCNB1IP1 homolog isoform X3 [Camellia sinensis]XP_028083578.1 E3 ubiquitin-protein ligase CCNB1IP1 homolog isoform X3 [Camellia sinensis]
MKPVDINPNNEWINMAMAGISPQILMKSAYRSVMFYIGQQELEMQFKMNRIVAQCRQKCETMQEKFTEKLEQVHTAYQKMAKRCQMLEQEIENLTKDKQELQENFSEKSRQKRKLDEMYDQLRSEYDTMKQSAIQPGSNFYSRTESDLFSNPPNMIDNRDPIRKDWSVYTPETPGPREDIWPTARQNSSNSGPFDISGGSPAKQSAVPIDAGNRRTTSRPAFGGGASNPSMTLRNLILSPIKRPQLSRSRPQMFML